MVDVHNETGLPVRGFHVHDGEVVPGGKYKGFTNFGPIVFFLKTSDYWARRAAELSDFPLPLPVALPNTDYLSRRRNFEQRNRGDLVGVW